MASVSNAQTIEAPANETSVTEASAVAVEAVVKEKTTQEIIEESFKDTPLLARIASCESHNRQFDETGKVLRGEQNPQDVGLMQINEKYHLGTAQKLGIDIYTLEGNIAYAKYLYSTQGSKPWVYSSKCWNKAPVEVASAI